MGKKRRTGKKEGRASDNTGIVLYISYRLHLPGY